MQALDKEPLMTLRRRHRLPAFTTDPADMTMLTTRGFLLIGEAARDVAP